MVILIGIFPMLMDIPNILAQRYITTTIETVGWSRDDNPDTVRKRTISVKDLTTEKNFKITVYHTSIYQGEKYKIFYLPYTRWASIDRKL